jgi:HlyD family secretion protein
MSEANSKLSQLQIPDEKKTRRRGGTQVILVAVVLLMVAGVVAFFNTRRDDRKPIPNRSGQPPTGVMTTATAAPAADVVLTVSGYIIPRERIEISPKFQGTVTWIGVKKGDRVNQGDVIVKLEDSEFQARVLEGQGRVAQATANLTNAELNLTRQLELTKSDVDSARALDEARRARDAAAADLTMAKGQSALAQTYLDWCIIRAPITGTILEKLVDPNELVVPNSFGSGRGPSTAFVSMADLNDLQVEIDLNETDIAKVRLQQGCRVSPEAYPDKVYRGVVTEIAPEANRQKGTLQLKVQIQNPDVFLTPELTAKVDFLKP